VESISDVTSVGHDGDAETILETERPLDVLADLALRLRDAGITPRHISVGRRSLEDLFFDIAGREEQR
jgi:hypothetical protein